MTEATKTNQHGFPIQTCTRCNGSGQYSYNQIHGTMCYGCGGCGTQIVKKAKPAWIAFVAHAKSLKETHTKDLISGVAYRNGFKGSVPKIVESVEKTDEKTGGWYQSGKSEKVYNYFYIVKFADGTIVKDSGSYWKRTVTLEDLNVDFYLAQIPQRKVKK
jgi:hypothetical protein